MAGQIENEGSGGTAPSLSAKTLWLMWHLFKAVATEDEKDQGAISRDGNNPLDIRCAYGCGG